MIEVKTAVANALEFVGQMYPEGQIAGPRLEEVELSEDSASWYITLSFVMVHGLGGFAAVIKQDDAQRVYKVIAVSSQTGEVRSMKMRQTV